MIARSDPDTLPTVENGSVEPVLREKEQVDTVETRQESLHRGSFLIYLKPHIFTTRKPRKLDRTSYLNGLRGLACLFVVFHHGTEQFYPWVRAGFMSTEAATNPLSLPVIRLWLSGHAMVDIFFVISGYVLSAKPLRLAREGRHGDAYKTIASSTLRRGPRLLLPCLAHTLVVVVFMRLGWLGDRGLQKWAPLDSLVEEMMRWMKSSLAFISPFSGGHDYEAHLWTMPAEFQGSLLVYLVCLAFGRSSNTFRSVGMVVVAGYWLYMTHWFYFLFTSGMICADIRLMLEPAISLDVDPDTTPKRSLLNRVSHGIAVFACLWILSFPRFNEGASESPGYATLVTLIPPSWRGEIYQSMWWLVITAPVFIFVLDSAGPESIYQKFLTSGFIQYLGDISFALYLCHGIWINSLGIEMVWSICDRFGIERSTGGTDYTAVVLFSSAVVLPCMFWHSEVFTRTVDKVTLRIAYRLTKL